MVQKCCIMRREMQHEEKLEEKHGKRKTYLCRKESTFCSKSA